jgi:hypothetical protein
MKLPWLFYLFLFMHVSTALVGGFRYKSLPRPMRILEWLVVLSVVDTIGKLILIPFHYHTLWLSHYFTLFELMFITFMYALWFKLQSRKKILYWSLVGFTLLWIIGKVSFEPFSSPDDWTATVSKVLQIAFSIYILIDVIRESDILWTNDPRMWAAAGIILYAAGTLIWFALFNRMLQDSPELLRQSYSVNWTVLIISNLFFIRGFLCKM